MSRLRMTCRICGSGNVLADAFAAWGDDAQRWEVQSTFEKGAYCQNCDGKARIDCVEADDS